jgi:transglutaminase-like putative cysteine protease
VEDTVTDSPSPLDTLASRKGNCQSHARLYASLARAAEIPTRFVSGLAYLEGKGFLYHSWAESFVEGEWLQVDPTFGQVPVDATHVKLVEGESPDDLAAIAGVVGKISARVIETK